MTPGLPQPIYRQFFRQADRSPDNVAITSGSRSISYGELAEAVRARTGVLRQRGVSKGDRIVLLAAAQPDFVSTYFAAHAIGATCVPLDPHISDRRFSEIVERVSPALVVAESPGDLPQGGLVSFEELASSGHHNQPVEWSDVGLSGTADILFTTGTTARPKGVVLSHGAQAAACAHINAFIGTSADAIEVLPLPLSHSFGLGRLRCVLSIGARIVLTRGVVSAGGILKALVEHRATGFASVPSGFAILLSDRGPAWQQLAGQLEYIEIGSAAMPLDQKRDLMMRLPDTRICMHYGLTEASRSAYLSFHDDSDRLESIGRPSPGVEMRIVDGAGGEVQTGTDGRIQVRGKHLMSAYWQDPELTAKTLQDGWLDTGDLGRRDEDGYFYLSGRSGDTINIGGRKVSPGEIEAILQQHPAIAECACIGIPDPQGLSAEIISTYLVARRGVEELPKFSELAKLLRQNLESYKIPRRFQWIDALPKSSSGKLLRRKLREHA